MDVSDAHDEAHDDPARQAEVAAIERSTRWQRTRELMRSNTTLIASAITLTRKMVGPRLVYSGANVLPSVWTIDEAKCRYRVAWNRPSVGLRSRLGYQRTTGRGRLPNSRRFSMSFQ